jgi:hypothetical protein
MSNPGALLAFLVNLPLPSRISIAKENTKVVTMNRRSPYGVGKLHTIGLLNAPES